MDTLSVVAEAEVAAAIKRNVPLRQGLSTKLRRSFLKSVEDNDVERYGKEDNEKADLDGKRS